jgi:hypothetical protein
MSNGNTPSGKPGRHTARKNDARDLAARTGMSYSAAVHHFARTSTPWEPRYRWIITDDLRDWIDGRTWRGVGYPDLRAWLDDEVSPVFDCHWCDEPGDAREEDCCIELLISEYDPDLQPTTEHLSTHKFHARCKPARDASPMFGRAGASGSSSIAWLRKAIIPTGPQRIALPASMKPEISGEFDLTARALLAPGRDGEDDASVLLVTARVAEDHGQGARPWLTELQLHLNSEGLDHPDSLGRAECGWSLRIATGYSTGRTPDWIALRLSQEGGEGLRHLLLCSVDMPEGWADTARRSGRAIVVIGPCTAHWDNVAGIPGEVADEFDDLREDDGRGCACDALTAWHLEDLVDEGSFVTAAVPVVNGEN